MRAISIAQLTCSLHLPQYPIWGIYFVYIFLSRIVINYHDHGTLSGCWKWGTSLVVWEIMLPGNLATNTTVTRTGPLLVRQPKHFTFPTGKKQGSWSEDSLLGWGRRETQCGQVGFGGFGYVDRWSFVWRGPSAPVKVYVNCFPGVDCWWEWEIGVTWLWWRL